MLPEDCVSKILSLTSPLDACRSSGVSSVFGSAASSDLVWERFLPSDHRELINRLVKVNGANIPLKLLTKKELFFHLCNPVLIDGGRKSFKIERSTGKKSYLLSARELLITWSDETMYWSWKRIPQSRFAEVAELRTITWLEICGKIRTRELSENTTYTAHLIMNIAHRAYGLATIPFEVSVLVGDRVVSRGTVHVDDKSHESSDKALRPKPDEQFGTWTEVKLGDFFAGEDDEEMTVSFTEIRGCHLKAGLVIEGIELRPKETMKGLFVTF